MSITTYQLRHHAQALQAQAAEALRMADEIEKLPDPINQAITDVVAMLRRHGICAVSRTALMHAEVCAQAFEPDGLCEEEGHKAVLAAIKKALEKS